MLCFQDENDIKGFLQNGVYFDDVFNAVQKYVHERLPRQCFKCQSFGHIASFRKNSVKCSKCRGHHNHAECQVKDVKCANCDENHHSHSKLCKFYATEVYRLNSKFINAGCPAVKESQGKSWKILVSHGKCWSVMKSHGKCFSKS